MPKLTFHKTDQRQARALNVPKGTIVQVEIYSDDEMARNYEASGRKNRNRIAAWYPNVQKEDDGSVYPWTPQW